MNFKCIFFDLDHTLWDFETNSSHTLTELYDQYDLESRGIRLAEFLTAFVEVNTHLWDLYDRGLIQSDVIRLNRFKDILKKVGVEDDELSIILSADYIRESPRKGALIPHATEILEHLHKRYPLYIITNGFDEVQSVKLASSGITHYFKDVITSARAGHKKPSKEIFEFALQKHGFASSETVMIGDNLATDIQGARNASIATIYFNPKQIPHQETVNFEIQKLNQLYQIL